MKPCGAECDDWPGHSSVACSSGDGSCSSGAIDTAIGLVGSGAQPPFSPSDIELRSGADKATPLDVPSHGGAQAGAQAGPSTVETAEPAKRERRKRDLDTNIPLPPALRDQAYGGEHDGYKKWKHVSFQGDDLKDSTAGNETIWLSLAKGKVEVNKEPFTAAGGAGASGVRTIARNWKYVDIQWLVKVRALERSLPFASAHSRNMHSFGSALARHR